MKYQVRQKIISLGDSFTIKDEDEQPQFIVKGKVLSIGNKLSLEDLSGNQLFYIEQKVLRFLPEYYIFQNGVQVAKVKKQFSFLKPKFNIESKFGEYEMSGDIFAHDFSILKNGVEVVSVSKKWIAFSDTYGVNIADEENQAFLLALVIVIDQVIYDED